MYHNGLRRPVDAAAARAQGHRYRQEVGASLAHAHQGFEDQFAPFVQQLAHVLHARVWVTDAQHVVVASSEADAVGRDLAAHLLSRPPRQGEAVGIVAPEPLQRFGAAELAVDQLDGEPVTPRLAQALAAMIANQTAQQFTVSDPHELKNYFVYNLLFENTLDEAALIRQGQALGIELTIPRAAILIDATNYILASSGSDQSERNELLMRQRTRQVISSIVNFFHLPTDTICAYVGGGEIVVLKASSARDLLAWSSQPQPAEDSEQQSEQDEVGPTWAGLPALKRAGAALLARIRYDTGADISLGIGRYHPGVRGLEHSYQDARAALSLGRRFHGKNQMYCLDSLGIAAFVGIADERTKVDLARRLLGPLDHAPELIETLDIFFGMGCSPSLTATQLCIHRNTLNYRLEKITSLTGLDPRRFDDALQIRLALLLRSL